MKVLTVLSVLQIAAITLLSFRLVVVERSINASMLTERSVVETELDSRPPLGAADITSQPGIGPNPEQLRRIVREELATALSTFSSTSPTQQSPAAIEPVDSREPQPPDYHYQLAVVESEIDYHISQGYISNQAMSDLQQQFTKLDQSGRKQMMRKLVKALNSGDLKGQL